MALFAIVSAPAVQSQDCCTPCDDVPITQVPGPAGADGAAGAAGSNGVSSYTTTTAAFTQPAAAATVSVAVATSAWAVIGQVVYVQNGGYYTVTAIADSTHLTLNNLGYVGNAAPAAVIGSGQKVGPGGLKGVDGVAVGVTLNSISPTTTRGDIIVDNGANAPAASVVRFPVGSDGQIDVADSTQAAGRRASSVHPNASATTDNQLARYDTPVGTEKPAPVQTSSIKLTDNGALQHTGGNAKGTDAVDLQASRAVVTQVASGANSFVVGKSNTGSGASSVVAGEGNVASGGSSVALGNANVASGLYAVAEGAGNTASNVASSARGLSNTASAQYSTVAGGTSNTASGDDAVVAGGNGCTASAADSNVSGGLSNQATAIYSTIPGGAYAKAELYGQQARANGRFAATGDAQVSDLIWRVSTTDATVGVEAFLDGAGASQRASIAVGKAWVFQILAIGRSSAGVEAAWKAEGCIHNNAGTTALVGGAITPVVIADGTGATWGVAGGIQVTADNGNDSLKISVTGAAATLIRWVISARIVEVSYP